MTSQTATKYADKIVQDVLAFMANPDPRMLEADDHVLYVSWLTDNPQVPKLALTRDILPEEATIAHDVLAARGVTIEDHQDGLFCVVLDGPLYANVLPLNLLVHINMWLSHAEANMANRVYSNAESEITTAQEELARYHAMGWRTDYPQYQEAIARLDRDLSTLADLSPILVQQDGLTDPQIARRLAALVESQLLAWANYVTSQPLSDRLWERVSLQVGTYGRLIFVRETYHDGEMAADGTQRQPDYRVAAEDTYIDADVATEVRATLSFDSYTATSSFHSTATEFGTVETFLSLFERKIASRSN